MSRKAASAAFNTKAVETALSKYFGLVVTSRKTAGPLASRINRLKAVEIILWPKPARPHHAKSHARWLGY